MGIEIITAQILVFSVKGFQGIEDVKSEIIYLGSNSVSFDVKENFAFHFACFAAGWCFAWILGNNF